MAKSITMQRVLLKRPFYLGSTLYEPNVNGTELPTEINGRPVVLWEEGLTEKEAARKKGDKSPIPIILPEDAVVWSDKATEDFNPEGPVLLKGHPKIEVPLSSLIPGTPDDRKIAQEQKEIDKAKAEEAKTLLDPAIVGKK